MKSGHHAPMPVKTFRSLALPRAVVLLTAVLANEASAQGNTPLSLKGVAIPVTPGLLNGKTPIVINKTAAIALGKALFWDSAVGSDGIACASCHFHAGADARVKNQLATGEFNKLVTGKSFQKMASGSVGGVNYSLKRSDFPLYQLADPLNKDSKVLFNTDDVVSSSGVFLSLFNGLAQNGSAIDDCASIKDAVFHVGTVNARQVQDRHVPSVINAGFNFRNFWDGRANNIFNGVSPYGARDVYAGIWVKNKDGRVTKQSLRLENASLASQAVAPGLNDSEMSCKQRSFPSIARKLLLRRALASQQIHSEDSVLAGLRHSSGKGLKVSYQRLIKTAFAPRYWAGTGDFGSPTAINAAPYNHMEANFSLFLGLALQLYQQTLVSDQSPFDTPRDTGVFPHMPKGLNTSQRRGLKVFLDGGCNVCHTGPTLSAAAHPDVFRTFKGFSSLRLVNRDLLNGAFIPHRGTLKPLMDEGYFNTSVTPENNDLGVGGKDPFGNPLSFSGQYAQQLLTGKPLNDPVALNACDFNKTFTDDYQANELRNDPYVIGKCSHAPYAKIPTAAIWQTEVKKGKFGRAFVATQGAFKVPSLRNVELTGPYMHNGSLLTLEQVVDFYFRGGNFNNDAHFAALVLQQPISPQEKADLVAFLKSLTDERVRWEKAPFDHPQLRVPHGHSKFTDPNHLQQAEDLWLTVPAVGKKGRNAALGALKAFEDYLEP
ncbi:CorB [Crenothrix polyspora]|uniref:CorB n=2 Tax=Crenothrix polyspora TaxID=360316 RepID=A0A1R4H2I4_9GAMM|nr:CorB [Crenothrix polyspora]